MTGNFVPSPSLRSTAWFSGHDEVAVLHRAALRSMGHDIKANDSRPIIGIANSASDLNPCNRVLDELAIAAAEGISAAGGIPLVFPVMSLGEDLMKPTAMLYRNLVAMEIEETLRSYPLDGVVLLANCDKTVPAALMGAASADVPAIMVIGGARPIAEIDGRRLASGTSLWRSYDDHRAGRLDSASWSRIEECMSCGIGSCNSMGTATTMALLTEAMGMTLSGMATIPAGTRESRDAAAQAGRRSVELVRAGIRPSDILTPAAFDNALAVLAAIGGSTNAVLHLCAIAGRLGISLPLERFAARARDVPVIVDLEPTGTGLVQDLHAAGGLPTVLRVIRDHLDPTATTVTGRTIEHIAAAARAPSGVVRELDRPVTDRAALAVVRGNLAPDGAILKACSASPHLLEHRGPALVFDSYTQMRERIDDPNLDVRAETVLILAGCGPVGAPGMPEWGMIPIPAKLAAEGVTDMVRISDARMSGTSFGTVFLHVAPEAAVGGPLALVRTGDEIAVATPGGRLDLLVDDAELARRQASWSPPASPHIRGWPALYRNHVTQAPTGCDFDFLQGPTAESRRMVAPTIGRS